MGISTLTHSRSQGCLVSRFRARRPAVVGGPGPGGWRLLRCPFSGYIRPCCSASRGKGLAIVDISALSLQLQGISGLEQMPDSVTVIIAVTRYVGLEEQHPPALRGRHCTDNAKRHAALSLRNIRLSMADLHILCRLYQRSSPIQRHISLFF